LRLALHPFAENQHQCRRLVARRHHAFEQRGRQARGEVFARIAFAKLMPQRMRQRAQCRAKFGRVFFGQRRRSQGQRLTNERTRVVQQLTPELARFPPAVITGVVAKAEKHRESDADERERRSRVEVQRDGQQMIVRRDRNNRDRENEEEPGKQLRKHRAAPRKQHAEPMEMRTDDHRCAVP